MALFFFLIKLRKPKKSQWNKKSIKTIESLLKTWYKNIIENVEEIEPIEINGKLSLWEYD